MTDQTSEPIEIICGEVVCESALRQAAQAGAALLDERYPGWQREINPRCLKLSDTDHCILGQLYGGFCEGQEILGIDGVEYACGYGFHVPSVDDQGMTIGDDYAVSVIEHQYGVLDDAWHGEILKRGGGLTP